MCRDLTVTNGEIAGKKDERNYYIACSGLNATTNFDQYMIENICSSGVHKYAPGEK